MAIWENFSFPLVYRGRRSPLQLAIMTTTHLQWEVEAILQGMPGGRLPICGSATQREMQRRERAMQRSPRQLARASWVQEQENRTYAMLRLS